MQYLITYYSKTGTTKEIAEQLAHTLQERGRKVDVLPLEEATDLSPYSHVLLGAPINGMQWVPQAQGFLQAHADELTTKTVSLFTVSYVMHSGWGFWKKLVTKGITALADTVGAQEVAHFRGRIDSPLPGPIRLLFGIRSKTPLDLRTPTEVTAWADELAARH